MLPGPLSDVCGRCPAGESSLKNGEDAMLRSPFGMKRWRHSEMNPSPLTTVETMELNGGADAWKPASRVPSVPLTYLDKP